MNSRILLLLVHSLLAPGTGISQDPLQQAGAPADASQVVEKMRGLSIQLSATAPSNGTPDPTEQRRIEIVKSLRRLGGGALPSLVDALGDPDVQMRRN